MTDIAIRPAMPDDLELLWEFLAMAAYEADAATAKAIPVLAIYLDGWQRPGDFGFIAEQDGIAVGGIWARQFASRDDSRFYIDDRTPEISIGVRNHTRGLGVGQALLRAAIAEAPRRGVRLCLNVRHTNPARRLYERVGFKLLPEMTVANRVGGQSFGMLWDGQATPPAPAGHDGA